MAVTVLTEFEDFGNRSNTGAEWAGVFNPPTSMNFDTGTITTAASGNGVTFKAALKDTGVLQSDAISSALVEFDFVLTSSDPAGGLRARNPTAAGDTYPSLTVPSTLGAASDMLGSTSGHCAINLIDAGWFPGPTMTRDELFNLGAGTPRYWNWTINSRHSGAFAAFDVRLEITNFQVTITDDTVVDPPAVTSIVPRTGPTSGGQSVTIRGVGFNAATGVTFGGTAATNVAIVSDRELTCTTPAHSTGPVDVVVVGVASGGELYSYVLAPFALPAPPYHSPFVQGQQSVVGSDWIKWFLEVQRGLKTAPILPAEQITGVFSPDQIPTLPWSRISKAGSSLADLETRSASDLNAGILKPIRGGTGFSAYTIGDLLYADSAYTLAKLADVSAGSYLRSGGVGAAPVWSTLKLPNAATTGDLPIATSANTLTMLADVAAGSYLRSGGIGTAPLWSTLKLPNAATSGDILFATGADTYASQSPAALTRVDDTNVTLTLGGTPATSLIKAVSLTLGWTGTLAVSRGGTGTGTAFTTGSIIFAGASGTYSQDNANLFWDDTNNRLGVGTNSPSFRLDVASTSNTVGVRVASNTADDVLYYGTGTVTGDLYLYYSEISATGTVQAQIRNTRTSGGSSKINTQVGGASAGDPFYLLTVSGVTNWVIGIDNSDNDILKIGPQASPSDGGMTMALSTGGNVGIGATTFPGTGTAALVFGDGTAPTSLASNTAAAYAEDDAGTVQFCAINEAGISSQLTGKIGYMTGAGGTVTQATNKSTGVTLNKVTGLITMDAATLNAATAVSFTLTNAFIAATDTIILQHDSAGTAGAYTLTGQPGSGSAVITVYNVTAGNLGEAIVIRFTVLKSVSA